MRRRQAQLDARQAESRRALEDREREVAALLEAHVPPPVAAEYSQARVFCYLLEVGGHA